jgi:hypothetical protein
MMRTQIFYYISPTDQRHLPYNNFTDGEPALTPTYLRIDQSGTASTTINNGILEISASLTAGENVAYDATTVDVSSHPYIILFAKMSIKTANGIIYGPYLYGNDGFYEDLVFNVMLSTRKKISNGFYIVTYHSDWWGPTAGGTMYYSTQPNEWYIMAEWILFDGYYTTVYAVAYDTYGNVLGYSSTVITQFTNVYTFGIGFYQLTDTRAGVTFIGEVDWIFAIDYNGWPYRSLESVRYINTKEAPSH